ncbi:bifunctional diguanylate cyclase/phosphodiesterase [Roseococcus sp. MDT2-1-1]|uniref:Bifunctional diguanylate cyclase/phosphodiesterase n=2 Tax=Sabulicella glaciei TaxID=2984948 RepID=A0ABT3NUY8_9PROT|nr:bifunctional diguanylate cyclase/phosphodiesterase [Roseococcus sp. MDT2-1-1]
MTAPLLVAAALLVALPGLALLAARRAGLGLLLLDRARCCRWQAGPCAGARRGMGFDPIFGAMLDAGALRALRAACEAGRAAARPAALFVKLPGCWRLAVLAPPPPPSLPDGVPVGVWLLDPRGRTLTGNRPLARLLGGAIPEGVATAGLQLCGPAGGEAPLGLDPGKEREALLRQPGQKPRRLLASASPAGGGWLLSLLDVTPLRTAQERIEHLAGHDPLTGLPNRGVLRAALDALAEDPGGGTLIRLDLDQLRAVNDRHGQGAGDALLRVAAGRLRAAIRPSDLAARLGGNEFAVLAFGLRGEGAMLLADRLRESLLQPVRHGTWEATPAARLGVAWTPDHGDGAEALMHAAQHALREAKRKGLGAASFEPRLLERARHRALLRDALAEALAEGGLALHIQPQRHLRTGALGGAEALLRWDSARLGRMVPPTEILAAAGEAGLTRALDQWVLRGAIALQREWLGEAGLPQRLGVNISAATLQDPGFAEEVAAALDHAGLPPSALEIEIPEDLAVRDLPAVAETVAALREAGVVLALDDFGAGHSSLAHVVKLPVHRVKLDRSTIERLPDDPRAYAVLRSTLAMARGLELEVVAEGVETEAQAEALRRLGCHVAQGWLVARPMPPEALRDWCAAPVLRAVS